MPRISKVTTKTGDDGTTGLADGSRLSKADNRVHLMGEIDELNAFIGYTIELIPDDEKPQLIKIQHDLFDIGAELCQPNIHLIDEPYLTALETELERFNVHLPPLKEFILPGGSQLLAQLHICRTVCRRCERSATLLINDINPVTYQYLNRLSDFLFVYARYMAVITKTKESYWQSAYSRKS